MASWPIVSREQNVNVDGKSVTRFVAEERLAYGDESAAALIGLAVSGTIVHTLDVCGADRSVSLDGEHAGYFCYPLVSETRLDITSDGKGVGLLTIHTSSTAKVKDANGEPTEELAYPMGKVTTRKPKKVKGEPVNDVTDEYSDDDEDDDEQ